MRNHNSMGIQYAGHVSRERDESVLNQNSMGIPAADHIGRVRDESVQNRPGPAVWNSITGFGTLACNANHNKPWQVDRETLRQQNLDKMATEILASEAMKLITEAYEEVVEGKNKHKQMEGSRKVEDEVGSGEIMKLLANVDKTSLEVDNKDTVEEEIVDQKGEKNSQEESATQKMIEIENDIVIEKPDISLTPAEENDKGHDLIGTSASAQSSMEDLRLTVEGLKVATKAPVKVTRGVSSIHLGPRWVDKNYGDEPEENNLSAIPPVVCSNAENTSKENNNGSPSISS